MRRLRVAAGGVAMAVAFSSCDLVRPNDPLALDPDVVGVEIVLFAGSQTVNALVGFPNRTFINNDARPVLALMNASTNAPLLAIGGAEVCVDLDPFLSFVSPRTAEGMECFSANLPFMIESGGRYRIEGMGPSGSFDGEVVVPTGPVLLTAAEDLVLDRVHSSTTLASFKLRWDTPRDVALVMYAVQDLRVALEDGSVREDCTVLGNPFVGTALPEAGEAQVELQRIICPPGEEPAWTSLRFVVQLVGFDAAFAQFIELADLDTVREPLPSLGLTGAVGFFGAAGVSEAVEVLVR